MADENIGKSVNESVDKHMNNQAPAPQFITVDAMKLNKGLRTTFWGVALIFDSLGMPADISNSFNSCVKAVEDNKAVKECKSAEECNIEPEPVGAVPKAEVNSEAKAEVEIEPKTEPKNEPVADEKLAEETVENAVPEPQDKKAKKAKKAEVQPEKPQLEPSQPEPTQAAPSVSVDDITKIIVQKIKQNRKNNEKIGAILKTYGASKVGELPEDKYEAFLTDLSAI